MSLASFLSDHAGRLLAMLALLLGSGFFSGSETAIFSLSASQVKHLRQRRRAGRRLGRLLARPQTTLNGLLLGNMIVNIAFAALSAVIVFELRQAGAPAWQTAVMSIGALLALILLGEVTPKMLAVVTTERWSLVAAPVVIVLGHVLGPVLWVLETFLVTPLGRLVAPHGGHPTVITAGELDALLDLSAKRGLLNDEANALLHEIVDLANVRVADVMTPRVDVIAWDINEPRQHLVRLVTAERLRRVVVYDGDIDHVLGLIHAKRLLLSPLVALRELVVPIPFVPATANIERVLLRFRATGRQVAIAVDEYGGTAGLIALDDILEEIVGDITRDDQRESGPAVEQVAAGQYVLDGNLAVHEWADAFGIDLHGGRISTIGGFVMSSLGRMPRVGDVVTYRNLRLTVQTMRGRRIGKLKLELLEDA